MLHITEEDYGKIYDELDSYLECRQEHRFNDQYMVCGIIDGEHNLTLRMRCDAFEKRHSYCKYLEVDAFEVTDAEGEEVETDFDPRRVEIDQEIEKAEDYEYCFL